MEKMLSGSDVKKIVKDLRPNVKANIVSYEMFTAIDDIEEVVPDDNTVLLILYPWEIDDIRTGHWISLCRDKNSVITYFDSYGDKVDHPALKEYKYPLSKLLLEYMDEGGRVEFNNVKLQGPKSNTCGRFASLWSGLANSYTVDSFAKEMRKLAKEDNLSTDQLVTRITNLFM